MAPHYAPSLTGPWHGSGTRVIIGCCGASGSTWDTPCHSYPLTYAATPASRSGRHELMSQPPQPSKVSFQEFTLFYQTTERVTDRRISMNRWNYSVSAAMLAAIGLVLNWSTEEQSNAFVGICGIGILCLMAIILCTLWVAQISDAKELNNAKFEVLARMAPLIEFETSSGKSDAKSYEPFDKEWRTLEARKAVIATNAGTIEQLKVLSASRAEYFIPKAMRWLFALILGVTLVFAITERDVVFNKMNPYSDIETKTHSKPETVK